ncbi:hypothetical protein C2G38_2238310 [Gigaspora rosea]|uniref:Uncharacterized protein n=1 Tax=Gigaspora rosea TaxID=44941 RepID=A0A397W6Q9_9GLOM|nr:hypothetical protein C2G38_2238310 [Gigaspora rosea]
MFWDDNNSLQQKDWINVEDTFVVAYNLSVHRAYGRTPHEIIGTAEATVEAMAEAMAETEAKSETEAMAETETIAETETMVETNAEATAEEMAKKMAKAKNNDIINTAFEQHILQISKIQQSVNDALGKYRKKMCQYGSVHRKKSPNNTIDPGTEVVIAPDHDMNPQTRKQKLQPVFSQ